MCVFSNNTKLWILTQPFWRRHQILWVKGFVLQTALTSDANYKPRLLPALLTYWLYIGHSMTPSLGLIDLLQWLTELRKKKMHIYHFTIKDTIKDLDEQPSEEVHWLRPQRVPSTGASVPKEMGCIILPIHGYFCILESSLNTISLGFYGSLFM